MNNIFDVLPPDFVFREPASLDLIQQFESDSRLILPCDYREFLLRSNGGEGQVGSAYFLFWPINNILKRNISAQITRYMSARFIGIGSNGGDDCYALDYTENPTAPKCAIVPLGDLDHASKFVIAPTITEALKKARDHEFSDADYNLQETGAHSAEIEAIRLANIRFKANEYWQKKDYAKYIELAKQLGAGLTPTEKKKIELASHWVKGSGA